MPIENKPHFFLKNITTPQDYTGNTSGRSKTSLPNRNRALHGKALLDQIVGIWVNYENEFKKKKDLGLPIRNGEYISVISAKDSTAELKSLSSNLTTGAKLLNVKKNIEQNQESVTLFIPEDKKENLANTIKSYLNHNHIRKGIDKGVPKHNPLISKTEIIRKSSLVDFWNSNIDLLPTENKIWVELWFDGSKAMFEESKTELIWLCGLFNIEIGDSILYFPERTIINLKMNGDQMSQLINSYSHVAEFRKSEELNSFWIGHNITEREEWIDEMLARSTFTPVNNFITILDTGVNNKHSLISPVLDDVNKLTVDVNWGNNDVGGHGTMMAGVAVYGNLNEALESVHEQYINHQLESIKIIPPDGNSKENKLPFLTQNAINTGIINNPELNRIYCMAVTSDTNFDFGKPSTWSALVDSMIFSAEDGDKKLFVISAGNVRAEENYKDYPEVNFNSQILSPAQSWNAITVGAFTRKILQEGNTVAGINALSPFSRTSNAWSQNWPIKPEVVFEGGNLELKGNGDIDFNADLEVLTTHNMGIVNKLTTINATSCATALAANFLVRLRHEYPNAWEETLRALMIHSSSWTNEMKSQLNFEHNTQSRLKMLKTFGYGVPDIIKAIESKHNYLTFITEQSIQPYIKEAGKDARTNKIHYIEFPWPKEVLENMGNDDVTLRVTLSYFIEPNPGEKGYSTKYTYQSSALKFSLIRPDETRENFIIRTNKINRDRLREELNLEKGIAIPESELSTSTGNDRWMLGADNIFKGSIHSNYWVGSAVEIASCNIISIYPQASGWWKNLKTQNKYNESFRYSLVVSIETPENSEDIYTAVEEIISLENIVEIG